MPDPNRDHANLAAGHDGPLRRVIALHYPDDDGYCDECTAYYDGPTGVRWPCDTIRAITEEAR